MSETERNWAASSHDSAEKGHFEYRRLFESAPDRTGNWAIKMTGLPDGRIIMVWCSTAGPEVDITNKLWISFSSDDGATWSEPQIFAESTPEGKVLGPCCYTHTDGTVFVFYNYIYGENHRNYDIRYQTSDDSGRSWSNPVTINTGERLAGLMSGAILLESGTILLPIYYETEPRYFIASAMLSKDEGKTWIRGGDMVVDAREGATEPSIAEVAPDVLYCIMRTTTGCQYESWSHDGGMTWAKPKPSPFVSPAAMAILLRLASGNFIVVWDKDPARRYPLFAALSEDGCKTWPYQKMIHTTDGQKQLSNHGVFQTASGMILVATNHFQGIRGGIEYGPVELARFDEEWIKSVLSHEAKGGTDE